MTTDFSQAEKAVLKTAREVKSWGEFPTIRILPDIARIVHTPRFEKTQTHTKMRHRHTVCACDWNKATITSPALLDWFERIDATGDCSWCWGACWTDGWGDCEGKVFKAFKCATILLFWIVLIPISSTSSEVKYWRSPIFSHPSSTNLWANSSHRIPLSHWNSSSWNENGGQPNQAALNKGNN